MSRVATSRAVLGLVGITIVYLAALAWIDSRGVLQRVTSELSGLVAVVSGVALMSWLIRFLRWHRLMRRAGVRVPYGRALMAYLAGFAFTATPGKVGELVRIRYFEPLGADPGMVVGLFLYERCLDLIAILLLAALAAGQFGAFHVAITFVLVVVAAVMAAGARPAWLRRSRVWLVGRGLGRVTEVLDVLASGLEEARRWLNVRDVAVSLGLGLSAWGGLAVGFAWLLRETGIEVPTTIALAVYPLATLVGAASMLPGGIGTTEAAIVSLLMLHQAPFDAAMLVAVASRVATLWTAVAVGLVCLWTLEAMRGRLDRPH
ncbi:MAG: YbhN family protein [Lautropia sp.]